MTVCPAFFPITTTLLTYCYLSANLTCQKLSAGFLPFAFQCQVLCVHMDLLLLPWEAKMLFNQGYMKTSRDVQIKRKASQRYSTQQGWAPQPEPGASADLTWEITMKRGVGHPSFLFLPNRLINRTWNMLVENYQFGWHQECSLFIFKTQVSRNKACVRISGA